MPTLQIKFADKLAEYRNVRDSAPQQLGICPGNNIAIFACLYHFLLNIEMYKICHKTKSCDLIKKRRIFLITCVLHERA